MADVAMTVVLHLVKRVNQELHLPQAISTGVRDIEDYFTRIQSELQYAKGPQDRREDSRKDIVKQVRDVAHEMEDVLDEFMMHIPRKFSENSVIQTSYEIFHDLKHWMAIHGIQSKIQNIETRMKKHSFEQLLINTKTTPSANPGTVVQSSSAHQAIEEDEVVGIGDPKESLIRLLTDGWVAVSVISVIGPGGSGKTVLVNSVCSDKRIVNHFDCRGWISLAGSFDLSYLRERLLASMGVHDVSSSLTNFLREKRYLVVLDDLRTVEDWRNIKQALPDDNFSRSRIIVITRQRDVASSCRCDGHHHIYEIPAWKWEDAWLLFCRRAFRSSNGECPPELQDVSQRIIAKCEGLPSAIAAVGSLMLKKRPHLPCEWEKVLKNLCSEILGLGSMTLQTMPWASYWDMSSDDRSCLLCFIMFPEEHTVKRGRLIRLWVAEGFVKESGNRSLEDVAEDHLNKLIERYLVRAIYRDCDGRVTHCQAPNLVRDFLICQSQEECFAVVMESMTGDSHNPSKPRRLSVRNNSSSLNEIRNLKLCSVRSLVISGLDGSSSTKMETILQSFKLLKVLDMEGAPLNNFPKAILNLTLLKFLSLRDTKVGAVPKSIKKLRYLEFLDLRRTLVMCLPGEVCQLQNLRYLSIYQRVDDHAIFDNVQGVRISGEISGLHHLQKLSLVKANECPSFFKELEKLEKLKKLG